MLRARGEAGAGGANLRGGEVRTHSWGKTGGSEGQGRTHGKDEAWAGLRGKLQASLGGRRFAHK
eukprot:200720-Chlamydomonas_euryale.AAC.1